MIDNGIAWMINDARRAEGERWLVESAQRRELRRIVAEATRSCRESRITRLARLVTEGVTGRHAEESARCPA